MENYYIPNNYEGIAIKGDKKNNNIIRFSTDVLPGSVGYVICEYIKKCKCCKECGNKDEKIEVKTHWVNEKVDKDYIHNLWSPNTKSISYTKTVIPN